MGGGGIILYYYSLGGGTREFEWNFKRFKIKKGKKKENYFWNTNRQLPSTQEHTRLVGDCLGVHISILIFILHQILTISYFSKFYHSFEKNSLLPNIPKKHQKIYKTPQNIDLCFEHRVFVLLETGTRYFH